MLIQVYLIEIARWGRSPGNMNDLDLLIGAIIRKRSSAHGCGVPGVNEAVWSNLNVKLFCYGGSAYCRQVSVKCHLGVPKLIVLHHKSKAESRICLIVIV